jgi:AcrR family transcriptional regulator
MTVTAASAQSSSEKRRAGAALPPWPGPSTTRTRGVDVPVRRSRSYHHGNLRRALLDAALAATAEHGSSRDVTLREAARRAGVSHNAPYRHFADREELLAALAEEGFAALDQALRAARAGVDDPEARFIATGLAYLRFAHQHPGHMAIMFGPDIAKSRTRALQRTANQAFGVLEELAADAGANDQDEARRLGTVVWSFLHGLVDLTGHGQVPRSVGAGAPQLATLGLQLLFGSIAAARSAG